MILSLSEVMTVPDKVVTMDIPLELSEVEFQGMRYEFLQKPPLSAKITNQNQKRVLVEGNADYTLSIPCSRCLESVPVSVPVKIHVSLDFSQEEGSADEMERESYLDGFHLDTDLLILGEILPSLPEKVLCREDCKGLCPMCGKNLNEGACGCRQEPSDPRMAQIQDIFKTFNLEES